MRATRCCSHFSKKVIWLRKFCASRRKTSRSLLEVNEAKSFKGSAKFTSQMAFLQIVDIENAVKMINLVLKNNRSKSLNNLFDQLEVGGTIVA